MRKRTLLWLPPILYMMAIFRFSAEPNPLPELTTHVWDKALHSIEYGGLALLLCRALLGEGLGWTAALVGATIIASIYGGTDEFHQFFIPGRDSSVIDWIADTIGSTLGALAYVGSALRTAVGGRRAAILRPSADAPKPTELFEASVLGKSRGGLRPPVTDGAKTAGRSG